MEDVPRLSDEHLEKAKEIISRHRKKKSCNKCYNRGYQGIDQLNMAVICYKCVDGDAVTAEWQTFVKETPALAEAYGDYFDSDEDEEAATEDQGKRASATDRSRQPTARDEGRGHSGPQMHRPAGR